MNDIEIALQTGDDAIDRYLSDTNVEKFKADIADLKSRYADKGVIKLAIAQLNKLITP